MNNASKIRTMKTQDNLLQSPLTQPKEICIFADCLDMRFLLTQLMTPGIVVPSGCSRKVLNLTDIEVVE